MRFDDNMGSCRWDHSRGVLGAQATADEAARVGISREGVYLQLSCPNCSMTFVADPDRSKQISQYDPDDMRVESVLITWNEIRGMIDGRINTLRLHKTGSGYEMIEMCPICSKHYAIRGLAVDPSGLPPQLARDAAQRRKAVSAVRPLDMTSLLRWYAAGKRQGFVK